MPSPRDCAIAHEGATVVCGNVRFTVLTPRVIRLEWSAIGVFDDERTQFAVYRALPVPPFRLDEDERTLTIDTGSLVLRYTKGDGPFDAVNLAIDVIDGDRRTTWVPGTVQRENLGGTYRTLDRYDGDTWQDGSKLPLEDGLLARDGWHVIDDSASFRIDDDGWVLPRKGEGDQDFYFFGYGRAFHTAIADFAAISGPQPMPPRFVFGYWWSRYWNYSDEELRILVARFDKERIPLDVLVLDMDWHTTPGLSLREGHEHTDVFGEKSGWTGYTFNRSLFPDPVAFMRWAHGEQLHVTLNLHPASGVMPHEEKYEAMARQLSWNTSTKAPIPYEGTSRPYMRALFDTILHPLEKQGVDFWWLDWQQWADSKAMPGLSNTWWLNHVFFTEMQRHDDARGLIYHRWGGLGNHRYPIGFSGDSVITWTSLAYQPHFTAMASNVLYGYWSHDIGGHTFDKSIPREDRHLDPELYARWMQYGVFSPVFRTHSAKEASLHKEPWHFGPPYGDAIFDAIRLRYRLAPYIYGASRDAYDTGVSIVRPMYYDWPEHDMAYNVPGQYMFGNDLLVAPVTVPLKDGAAPFPVWLPPGLWYSRGGAESFEGGQVFERSYGLHEIPIFVRPGSVIPLYPEGLRHLSTVPSTLTLQVFPGAEGDASLYDDDGATQGYQRGEYARTKVRSRHGTKTHRVHIDAMEGSYRGKPAMRAYTVELLDSDVPDAVEVNGRELPYCATPAPGTWLFDTMWLCIRVELEPASVDEAHDIVARFDPVYAKPPGLLHRMRRARDAVGYLKQVWNDISALPDDIDLAGQAARVLAYTVDEGDNAGRAARFAEAVREFERRFAALPDSVAATPIDDELKRGFVERLGW
ncbi:alpha-glucosidase (family GH31 glycosyl hydrolase) [Luteibacter rhizovicinus]|uniref:Alpha-glucosidase (Family GH31 glycosyl hydrolase) n=1 Tax=Luteibacter rhizovicinus TaxID=242606 RepID=A0A4R3YLY4_9GAMM|nr:glycoside hydrolase family 31 protein [Luteibacter rhizovicinus]TCV93815.1 alpha-glucosidase (family GH31 glycosyl hydrolase) [Luteibacter rhizovicinus]